MTLHRFLAEVSWGVGLAGRDMPPGHLSRGEEKEQGAKREECRAKAVWDCVRHYEIIMRNSGEEQVWGK